MQIFYRKKTKNKAIFIEDDNINIQLKMKHKNNMIKNLISKY